MKFNLTLLSASVILTSVALWGATGDLPKANLGGGLHDINGTGCKGCHAPHNGSVANGLTDQSTGVLMLWARNLPTVAAYGVYDSPAMDTSKETPSEVADAAAGAPGQAFQLKGDVRMYSLLCLSCHDGVTSTTVKNAVNMVGSVANSNGLTNDHPINMPYSNTLNSSLTAATTVGGVNGVAVKNAATAFLPLYNGTMQCATCHDSHDDKTYTYFLRAPYANTTSAPSNTSTFCVNCHN